MDPQVIDNGEYLNDPTAEAVRNAFGKTNINFSEVYNLLKNQGYQLEYINIAGLDTTKPELAIVAEGINRGKNYDGNGENGDPFTAPLGKKIIFQTISVIPSGGLLASIVYRFYRIHRAGQSYGGDLSGLPDVSLITPTEISPAGSFIVELTDTTGLFINLGDIETENVWTAFNLGKPAPFEGDPWTIEGETFIIAIQNGVSKTWRFVGNERLQIESGDWGGDDTENPEYLAAIQQDFDLLSEDYNTSIYHTKEFFLSLTGIDTTKPELEYIRNAVLANGPFTCNPDQQMLFVTNTIVGTSQSNYGILKRYYLYKKRVTILADGGVSTDTLLPSDFAPLGSLQPDIDDESLFIDLGELAERTVESVFNDGDENGDAWVIKGEQFISATISGEKTIWLFIGIDGSYGGDDLGTDPDILEAVADDFSNLTEQPETPKTLYLNSLADVDIAADALLDGDVLIYDSASGTWKPGTQGSGGGTDIDPDTDIYADVTALIADQNAQEEGQKYFVTDATGFTTIKSGGALVLYLGTTDGDEEDYVILSNPGASNTELTTDELAAINGADSPSAGNVFATMADVGTTAGIVNIAPTDNPQEVFDATDAGSYIRFLPGLHEWGINNNSRTENSILYVDKTMDIELMAGATLKLADETISLSTEPEIIKNQGVVGLDDMTIGATSNYTGGVKRDYYIRITTVGATDKFTWGYFNEDNSYTLKQSGVSITGGEQTLDNGVKIQFGATTGHTDNSLYFICYDGDQHYGIRVGSGFHTDYIENVKIFGEGTVDLNRDNNIQPSLLAINTSACVLINGRVRYCDILNLKLRNAHRTVMAYGENDGTFINGGGVVGGESFDIEHLNIINTNSINLGVGDGCIELGHPEHRGHLRFVRCNDNYVKSLNTPIECNYLLREYEVLNNKIEGWSIGGYAIHCWRRSDNGLIMGNVLMNDPTGTIGMVEINSPGGWESAQNIRQFNNYNLNDGRSLPYPPFDGSESDPLANMIAYYPLAVNSDEDLELTTGIDGVDTAITYASSEAQLNGTTSKIVVPNNDIFDFTDGDDTPWTLTFKLKLSDNTSVMPISKSDGTTGWYVYLETGASSVLSITLNTSSGDFIRKKISSFTRSIGSYVNIGITYDATKTANGLKLYVDGTLSGTNEVLGNYTGLLENTTGLTFGKAAWADAHFLAGSIKDIRFYNEVKTQLGITEINAL